MNNTFQTCVRQALSATAVCHFLAGDCWVNSNLGVFISKTGNCRFFTDGLMGLKSGACGGIGSSQQFYADGFYLN